MLTVYIIDELHHIIRIKEIDSKNFYFLFFYYPEAEYAS